MNFAARWCLIVAILPGALRPQTPVPPPKPQFDVASIKPSKPDARMQDMRISFRGGRFEAVNITIDELLLSMSGFSGKVQGGPKWASTDRYDVIAVSDADIAPNERNQIVMALLEDRFRLAVHHEPKEEQGLALGVGKKSPKLDPAKDGEVTSFRADGQREIFNGITMFGLAGYLGHLWQTTVVDRTGIKGKFDFSVDFEGIAQEPSAQGPAARPGYPELLRSALESFGFTVEPQKVTRM